MDHDNMKESPDEKFLHEKSILTIDPVTATDIEMRARVQTKGGWKSIDFGFSPLILVRFARQPTKPTCISLLSPWSSPKL